MRRSFICWESWRMSNKVVFTLRLYTCRVCDGRPIKISIQNVVCGECVHYTKKRARTDHNSTCCFFLCFFPLPKSQLELSIKKIYVCTRCIYFIYVNKMTSTIGEWESSLFFITRYWAWTRNVEVEVGNCHRRFTEIFVFLMENQPRETLTGAREDVDDS